MAGPQYIPALASALGFAWPPLTVGDAVDQPAYNIYAAFAKYFGVQVQNEILGAQAMSVADVDWQNQYTCQVGDAVGSPVYISGNGAVTTASASALATSQVIGFIRFKGTLGAASVPAALTCYLKNFAVVTGLGGGTAGSPVYLTNAGGFSATPGTVNTPLGFFTSATTAMLFATGASGSSSGINPGLFSEIDLKTAATTTLTVPNSQSMNPSKLVLRLTTLGGTLTAQPFIQLGKTGTNNKYLATFQTTGLSTVGTADTSVTLLSSDATTSLTFTVITPATGSSTIKATALVTGATF